MCFAISLDHPEPKIAAEDIPVYKIGFPNWGGPKDSIKSVHKLAVYKRKHTYHVETMDFRPRVVKQNNSYHVPSLQYKNKGEKKPKKIMANVNYIFQGLHFHKKYNKEAARAGYKVIKMYIPKGARYWENKDQIVTETAHRK